MMGRLVPMKMRGKGRLLLCAVACSCSSGSASNSVLERSNHPSRDASFVQPALTRAAAARMAPDTGFAATFTGFMLASPLYLENGPHGKGAFFAVTAGNDVFALDETTGAVVWTTNVGPAPTASGAGCGNVHPIGIVSTPVIDAQARTIYVAGGIGADTIERHEVHALSVDDGKERPGWPIDASKTSAPAAAGGTLAFPLQPQNQRSALSLVGGILYVAYGGHVGDCGPYHGWVLAINTRNPTQTAAWATGGIGEGIWAPGGMASDGNGVFAVTGNATSNTTTHLDSEEVVRLTGMATVDRSGTKSFYFPMRWQGMDSADTDFGSSSPVYVELPGSTPSTAVVAMSKDGHIYLLDSKNLGGMNGHAVDYTLPGGWLFTAPAAYTTAAHGLHIALMSTGSVECPTAGATAPMMVSLAVATGAPPTFSIAWCVSASTTSPIATTTDGKSDAIVWFVAGDKLTGIDGDSGQVLFQESTGSCPNVRQWTSPIAVKGRIVAGADGRLCSWSPH
jgi:hypothetical protein